MEHPSKLQALRFGEQLRSRAVFSMASVSNKSKYNFVVFRSPVAGFSEGSLLVLPCRLVDASEAGGNCIPCDVVRKPEVEVSTKN